MKLRLPHKLQTALLAAVASVSFTTVSSATLGAAAAWVFFSGHAGAEDLTHDPILTQQLDHAKKIEFGKLSLSETGAEQVEPSVAKSSFGSGDVTRVDAAATLGGDIVDAVLCEGYSEAGGSWQADAAALSSTLDPAATSEFVTAEGLATVDSGEPVFSTITAAVAAPAAATSALDLAPQQDNSYYSGTTAASGSAVSAPSVGGGAGAVSVGGASGSTAFITRPVLRTAGAANTPAVNVDNGSSSVSDSVNRDADEEEVLTTNARLSDTRLSPLMSGMEGTTYTVTEDATYNASTMGSATSFVVNADVTFTASGDQIGGSGAAARPLTLNEGSTLVVSDDSNLDIHRQIQDLILWGDATVEVGGNIGVIAGGHAANELTLGGYALSLSRPEGGSGTKTFRLYNTTVTNGGTINVGTGVKLELYSSTQFSDNTSVTVNVAQGGLVDASNMVYGDNGDHNWDDNSKRFLNLLTNAGLNVSGGEVQLKTVNNSNYTSKNGCLTLQMGGASAPSATTYTFGATHYITGTGGNLRIAHWGAANTWEVKEGTTLDVGGVFWMDHRQTLKISGGSVIAGDILRLGYGTTDGSNSSDLEMTSGSLKVKAISTWSQASQSCDINITGGTVEFTGGENALVINGPATVNVGSSSTASPVYLHASQNSWVLNGNATIGNVAISTGTGKKITLGAAGTTMTLNGTISNSGQLALAGTFVLDKEADGILRFKPEADQNGFMTESDVWSIVESAAGASTDTTALTVSRPEKTITLHTDGENGSVYATSTATASSVYYVGVTGTAISGIAETDRTKATAFRVADGIQISASASDFAGKGLILGNESQVAVAGNTWMNQAQVGELTLEGTNTTAKITASSEMRFSIEKNSNYSPVQINLNGNTLELSGSTIMGICASSAQIDSGTITLKDHAVLQIGTSAMGMTGTVDADRVLVKSESADAKLVVADGKTFKVGGLEGSLILEQDGGHGGGNIEFCTASGKIHSATVTLKERSGVYPKPNLKQSGEGTQKLVLAAVSNATFGTVTVDSGVLSLQGSQAVTTGAVSVNGGTLDLSAITSTVQVGALTLGSQVMTLAEGDTPAAPVLKLGTQALDASSLALYGGTLDLGAFLTGKTDTSNPLTLVNSSGISGSAEQITLAGLTDAWAGAQLQVVDNNLVLALVSSDLYWRNMEGGSWNERNWADTAEGAAALAFSPRATAHFKGVIRGEDEPEAVAVILDSDVQAGDIGFDNSFVHLGYGDGSTGNYVLSAKAVSLEFSTLQTECNFQADSVSIDDGSAWYVTGKASWELRGTVSGAGTLVGNGGHVNMMDRVEVGALNLYNNTVMHLKDGATIGHVNVDAGSHLVTYGESALGGSAVADCPNMLAAPISNHGNLTLNGAWVLTGQHAEVVETMPAAGSNGFKGTEKLWNVVTPGAEETAVTLGDGATVSHDGTGLTWHNENGTVTATGYREEGTVYYVGVDIQDFTQIAPADRNKATAYEVGAGKTLKVTTQDIGGKQVILDAGSTLQASGITYFNQAQIRTLTLNGNATVDVNSQRLAVQAANDGSGAPVLDLDGNTLTILNTDSSSQHCHFGLVGDVAVTDGTIALRDNARLQVAHNGMSGKTVTATGATLDMGTGTALAIAGGNAITLRGIRMESDTATASLCKDAGGTSGNQACTLTLHTQAGDDFLFRGSISGGGQPVNLTMAESSAGVQRMEITGNSTLGSVTVDDGSLLFSGTGTLTMGAVTVDEGTLGFASAVTTGNLHLTDGGTLSLGGAGLLSSTGSVTLDSGTMLDLSALTLDDSQNYVLITGQEILNPTGVQLTFADSYQGLLERANLEVIDHEGRQQLVLTFQEVEKNLLWVGGDEHWLSDNVWQADKEGGAIAPFVQEANVRFGSGSFEDPDVICLCGDTHVQVGNMLVDEDAVVQIVKSETAAEAPAIIADSIEIRNGAHLKVETPLVTPKITIAGFGEDKAPAMLTINARQNMELSAAISGGTGSTIDKQGDHMLTLTGDNKDFSGSIYVSAGSLVAESATALGTGDVTVLGGADLVLTTPVSTGSLYMEKGSTLVFEKGAMLTLTDELTLGSGITFDLGNYRFDLGSAGEHTANLIAVSGWTGSTESLRASVSTLLTPMHVSDASLSYDGQHVMLTYTVDSLRDLIWQGGAGAWSTEEKDTNWYENSGSSTRVFFEQGDSVSFVTHSQSSVGVSDMLEVGTMTVGANANVDLHAAASATGIPGVDAAQIALNGNLTTSIQVDAGSIAMGANGHWTVDTDGSLKVAGTISGTGTITKTGEGTLAINGDNSDFAGHVVVQEGTLQAGGENGTALGTAPVITMAGGTLAGNLSITGDAYVDVTRRSTITANMDLGTDATLYVDAMKDAHLTMSGNLTGEGGLSLNKNGAGTLILSGENSLTGGIVVEEGTLLAAGAGALGGASAGTVTVNAGGELELATAMTTNNIVMNYGGTLTFAGADQLTATSMKLGTGSILDVSGLGITSDNITFTNGKAEYVLANVTNMSYSENYAKYDNIIEFVALTGLDSGLNADNIAHLRYDNNKLILSIYEATPGYYWKGTGTTWDTTSTVWSDNEEYGNSKSYVNQEGRQGTAANSAYFLKDITQVITLADSLANSTAYVRDMVIGSGDYTFKGNGYQYLQLDSNRTTTLLVRGGAKVHFDGVQVSQGSHGEIRVEEEGVFTSGNTPAFGVYTMVNHGVVTVDSDSMGWENLMGHIVNNKQMNFHYQDTYGGFVLVGSVVNNDTMTLSAPMLLASLQYGEHIIQNDGNLTFDVTGYAMGEDSGGSMSDFIPVVGLGTLSTAGGARVVLDASGEPGLPLYVASEATVQQTNLVLGATTTTSYCGVDITDSTTVKAGSAGEFYGGNQVEEGKPGSFGQVTLEAGGSMLLGSNLTTAGVRDYTAGHVTAGSGSRLEVETGAAATITDFNAGGATDGEIVVGTASTGYATEPGAAVLTVQGVANTELLRVESGTANMTGYVTTDQLTQNGGELNLSSGAYVDYGNVSSGTLNLTAGQVLTLGHVVTEYAGTYTLTQTTGSINADALDLVTSYENARYMEVVRKTDGNYSETTVQSGFMEGGMEKVKVFDVLTGANLVGNSITVTHKDASGPMTLISGATDEGASNYDENAGWAILDTSKVAYYTYYVRDNYVTAAADGRRDESEVSARTADQVKLSTIVAAATAAEAVVGDVKVDQTAYNASTVVGDTNFHGTLTVDQSVMADLFSVTDTSRGLINIAATDAGGKEVVVLADKDYAGVDGTLKLSGTGVYRIDNRSDLGNNVSLLTETTDGIGPWLGTVRVTGSSTGLDTTILGTGTVETGEEQTASTIDFHGWSGSFEEGQQVSNAHIVLSGDGITSTTAMTIKEGTANLVWNNDVTGENARITHSAGENVSLTMNGDTSGWTGYYVLSSADAEDTLKFLGGEMVNASVQANVGSSMTAIYGGSVTTVTGSEMVSSGATLNLEYTGTSPMSITGSISNYEQSGNLGITVGVDGSATGTRATFSGRFDGTGTTTMKVEEHSAAIMATDADLLRVVGDAGSAVTVGEGKTLKLTSADAENSYSEFHQLTNEGSIDMQANGGDIRLVVDDGVTNPTYRVGKLELTGEAGTAAIETSAHGQTVQVEITNLKSENAGETLQLTNRDGSGTVNYELGGKTEFDGTIEFGSAGEAGVTNVVLKSDDVAAKSVLESVGKAGTTANVVVDTANAGVLGITSADDASVAGKVYGTPAEGSEDNRQVTITGSDTYSYNGGLGAGLDVAYTGKGKQTFEGGATGFKGDVTVDNGTAEAGVLEVLNVMADASMSIEDLTIGANNTLVVKQGENVGSADANVTVSGTLLAKGGSTTDGTGNASRMDANLTLASGSTLNVAAAGGTGGLDLGGSLTIATGAMLSQADMATVWNMGVGDRYDLAFNVTGMRGFGEGVNWLEGVDASTVFTGNGMAEGEFFLRYTGEATGGNGGNVGTVYLYRVAVPEPTTGTLSLLALAALCARRRRK